MSIGLGIALFVIGAILTFALNFETGWINLDLVGWIMMIAGIVTVIVGIALLMRRRSAVSTTVSNDGVAQRTTDMDGSL